MSNERVALGADNHAVDEEFEKRKYASASQPLGQRVQY